MRTDLLEQVRKGLPPRLNAGILFGEGGCCILGWMLLCAGFHPIAVYGSTIGVVDPETSGPATQVVARTYDLPLDRVEALAQLNDRTPGPERVAAVAALLDELLGRAGEGA